MPELTWEPTIRWVAEFGPDLPPDVLARARLLVLDTVACAAAGLRHEQVRRMAAQASAVTPGTATWPGLPRPCSPAWAAASFTAAACWDEFCEGHAGARGRPGLHSVGLPLVLAADGVRPGGRKTVGDVLSAVVAGYEVGARFGAAMFTRAGLHVDGTWGSAAAAVAAARILDLDVAAAAAAADIAAATMPASQYRAAADGATVRNLYAARGVAGGFDAALAASAGVRASTDATSLVIALLGRPSADAAAARSALGQIGEPSRFALLDGYLKEWPGVRHTHYAVAAAERWLAEGGASARQRLRSSGGIELAMHPAALEYTPVRAPRSLLQAQFSSTYAAAYTLVHGTFGLEAFTPQAIADPEVAEVEERIELVHDDQIEGRFARLRADGREALCTVLAGDPGRPNEPAAILAKALSLLTPALGEAAALELGDWLLTADVQQPWCLPTA